MRITNKMITNNSLANINKNKNSLNKLDEQYTTGKKIQRPSDDPIIAVRALKLRTNVNEINQYYQKNIPDAKAWMDVTESALNSINTLLTDTNTYCTQGANGTLTASDRKSIAQNLSEIKEEIYKQGDTNYAGRYVFTGFKTDTSLIFNDDESDKTYTITETFSAADIDKTSYLSGTIYEVADYDEATSVVSDFSDTPVLKDAYRIRLSYGKLDEENLKELTYKDSTGTVQTLTINNTAPYTGSDVIPLNSNDVNAYDTSDGKIHLLKDTGELILPESYYSQLKNATDIIAVYDKTKFYEGDLRPENYFKCVTNNLDSSGNIIPGTDITYQNNDQDIQYEINFKQKLKINTQGKDAIEHSIGRTVDEILDAVNAVEEAEAKVNTIKEKLEETTDDSKKQVLNKLLSQLETELSLKNKVMTKKFQDGMDESTNQQSVLNVAVSDLGSRYVRLELTENRLSSQQIDFEDLMSTNEDADITETIIKYNSAETLYNASLSAASKVVQNTLLDFL